MSLSTYRELNKELVEKMQEYKKENAFLEREIIYINRKCQEEHFRRMEERRKFLSVIAGLKSTLSEVELYYCVGRTSSESCSDSSAKSYSMEDRRRTRYSGVTSKSPLRQSLQSGPTKNDSEEGEDVSASAPVDRNCWGISNIAEGNSPSGLHTDDDEPLPSLPLSRLRIDTEQLTPVRSKNSSNEETSTAIEVSSSSNCSEVSSGATAASKLFVPSVNKDQLNFPRTPRQTAGNSEFLSIEEFSHQIFHSTPNNEEQHDTLTPDDPKTTETYFTMTDEDTAATIAGITRKTKKKCSSVPSPAFSLDETPATTNDSVSGNMRPRRRCAPSSLVEPSVRGKLRNENATRKNRTSKSKPQTSKPENSSDRS